MPSQTDRLATLERQVRTHLGPRPGDIYPHVSPIAFKGADIPSAAALRLLDGNYFDVTGTTTITSIAVRPAGDIVILQFDGALILTHNATSLILQGAVNYTTAAGDVVAFISEGDGNWREVWRRVVTFFGSVGGEINIGDSASNGTAITASRSDHQHSFPAPGAGYPVDVGLTEADGVATTPARSDHAHAHGIIASGDLHTEYRLESADHTHQSAGAQAGTLDHGLALTGLTDDDHTQYLLKAGGTMTGALTINVATNTLLTLSGAADQRIQKSDSGASDQIWDFDIASGGARQALFFFFRGDSATTGRKALILHPGDGTYAENIVLTGAGAMKAAGLGAFAAGDLYVIVDASGNFHKSALGPAS